MNILIVKKKFILTVVVSIFSSMAYGANAATPPLQVLQSGSAYHNLKNTNLLNKTYRRIITRSEVVCETACDADQPNCKGLSWNKKTTTCELKVGFDRQQYDLNYDSAVKVPTASSDAMEQQGGYTEYPSTNLLNQTYRRIITSSEAVCETACDADQPNCKGLSWNKKTTTCELKVGFDRQQYDLDYDSAAKVPTAGTEAAFH